MIVVVAVVVVLLVSSSLTIVFPFVLAIVAPTLCQQPSLSFSALVLFSVVVVALVALPNLLHLRPSCSLILSKEVYLRFYLKFSFLLAGLAAG